MKLNRRQLRQLISEVMILEMGGPSSLEFMGKSHRVPHYLSGGSESVIGPVVEALEKVGDALEAMNHLDFEIVDFEAPNAEGGLFTFAISGVDISTIDQHFKHVKRFLENKVPVYDYEIEDISGTRSSMDPRAFGINKVLRVIDTRPPPGM